MNKLSAIRAEAQAAIAAERKRRDYQVVVGPARRAYGIAEVRMPKVLEAYVAETTCTEHPSTPCLWVDWAFRLPDGSFHVVLQMDLFRPGTMLEESVRVIFAEVEAMMRSRTTSIEEA